MDNQLKRTAGRPRGEFVTYHEAREWVRRKNFSNYKVWLKFAQERYQKGPLRGKLLRPRVIPANPQSTYKSEWVSDPHFLGHIPYLPMQDARKRIHQIRLQSYSQWLVWHKDQKPWYVPRYPDLVYDNWTSWGDFLGTNTISTWYRQKTYRPFNEAVKYIHSVHLTTENQYHQWVKEVKPKDLPAAPDVTYRDWQGWPHFLGSTLEHKVAAAQTDTRVFAILHYPEQQSNIFTIRIEPKGKSELLSQQQTEHFRIIKVYKYEQQYDRQMHELIMLNGSQWWEGEQQYLIRNISELLFQLDSILLWV